MATVRDLSKNDGGDFTDRPHLDRKLTAVNRANAGDPVGSLTPQYVGELVFDSTNERVFRGRTTAGSTLNDWVVEKT